MLSEKPKGAADVEIWKRSRGALCSTHDAMVSLTEWFVSNIPFSYDLAIDHHRELATRPIDDILFELLRMQRGCMCGGLTILMALVARREGYRAFELNFGRRDGNESHVVVLAGEPGNLIIYDPTFGCFSGNTGGAPVSIQTVISFLREGLGS